jgi:hypothetical protein
MTQVKDAARQAQAAFQANAYAGFADQAPHLRCLLENLPSRGVESGGEQMSLDAVLERLRSEWMCQHPPGSHDGAVHAELRDDNERLSITFLTDRIDAAKMERLQAERSPTQIITYLYSLL